MAVNYKAERVMEAYGWELVDPRWRGGVEDGIGSLILGDKGCWCPNYSIVWECEAVFSKAVKATITIPKRVSILEKSLIVNDDDIDMQKK